MSASALNGAAMHAPSGDDSGPGPDVVVVGAGIVGLSTALFLADAGARVVVLERESIACGASGAAAGMVSPFAEVDGPEPLDRLAEAGVGLHRLLAVRLREETGVDVKLRPLAILQAALTEADVAPLLERLGRDEGAYEWADVSTARALEPRLAPSALVALVAPRELQVDPYPLAVALAQAAERRGVTIRYASVLGLAREGPRIRGVRLRHGRVAADAVVLSAGPWSGMMESWLGWPMPVGPLRGQIVYLQAPGRPFRCCLMHGGNYLLPKDDAFLLAGTTEERAGFRARATQTARRVILAGAVRLAPSLEDAAVVRQTACLRPLSLDGLPVLGPVPGWQGLFVATGHGRRGILLGPISGQLTAELVLGRTPSLLVDLYDPGRFARLSAAETAPTSLGAPSHDRPSRQAGARLGAR